MHTSACAARACASRPWPPHCFAGNSAMRISVVMLIMPTNAASCGCILLGVLERRNARAVNTAARHVMSQSGTGVRASPCPAKGVCTSQIICATMLGTCARPVWLSKQPACLAFSCAHPAMPNATVLATAGRWTLLFSAYIRHTKSYVGSQERYVPEREAEFLRQRRCRPTRRFECAQLAARPAPLIRCASRR